ncbi:DNA replication ATP-dependent helicase/nuclease DNA2-like [Diadema antillarum]|uniref:DNA replication ATP-dependent helicase/nuclease DNA2-like n=1 Tax=Diadema antillarum TaxID=105358 RepID=UPI003A87B8E5
MVKPAKTSKSVKTKETSSGRHGHQSTIENFFKKKSEMPSALFTQVMPVPQKGTATPRTPESGTASGLLDKVQSAEPSQTKMVLDDSPSSQFIIPDTPENTVPRRQFTSLLTAARIDSKEMARGGGCVQRERKEPLSEANLREGSTRLNQEGELQTEKDKRMVGQASFKVSGKATKYPFQDENRPSEAVTGVKPGRRVSKLSRKCSKSASAIDSHTPRGSATGEQQNAGSLGQSQHLIKDAKVESREVVSEETVDLKPALVRVRNPFKRKESKLSLSRKIHKSSPKTGSGSVKRSPLRGNSPYSKRFQGLESCESGPQSDLTTNGVQKVRKSLMEQYGQSDSQERDLSTSKSQSRIDTPQIESIDDIDPITSENTAPPNEVHRDDKVLFSETETCISAKDDAGNQGFEEKTHQVIMDEADDPNFISVIPDSCPGLNLSMTDTRVIPDSQPCINNSFIPDNLPAAGRMQIKSCPDAKRVVTNAEDAAVRAEKRLLPSANVPAEPMYKHEEEPATATETDLKSSKMEDVLESPVNLPISSVIQNAVYAKRHMESTHRAIAEGHICRTSQEDLETNAVGGDETQHPLGVIKENTNSSKKSLHGATCEPKSPGTGALVRARQGEGVTLHGSSSSPGTAALWDGIDDSFLEDLDFEELDGMQEHKLTQGNSVASLGQKFAGMSPFKSKTAERAKLTRLDQRPADLCRYLVNSITETDSEKILEVTSLSDESKLKCILRDTWQESAVEEGMVVAIHGSFDAGGVCRLDGQGGFLVVNPDHLLTGTAVSNSIRCMRRSVLSEHFKGLERGNRAMLLGSLLHEVFDQALQKSQFQKAQLMQLARDVLKQPSFLLDMYSLKIDEQNLLEDVEAYAESIKRWNDMFLGLTQRGKVDIKWPGSVKSEKCGVNVSDVRDIEETVWSPRFGLKGKVDLTVDVKIHKPNAKAEPVIHTVPLELKTGRDTNSIEHRSQLILYSLMLGDLKPSPDLGFLLYLKTAAMKAVPANHLDKRELIHLRNQLAFHLSRTARPLAGQSPDAPPTFAPPILPEPIQDDFTCSRCAHAVSCGMLSKISGYASQLSSSMQELFSEKTNHLLDSHLQYFAHWYLLCSLEHEAAQKQNTTRNIWCKEASDREKDGECWSGMMLRSTTPKDQQHGGFLLAFSRQQGTSGVKETGIDRCLLTKGDRVVVSEEGTRRVAICVGFIEEVSDSSVKITTDSNLKPCNGSHTMYRIDKDASYNSMAASLVNLAKLMMPEYTRLRNLVVDTHAPTSIQKPNLPSKARGKVAAVFKELNEDQRAAVKAVLRSQDYTLIIGMPGTGKTTTIVALVRILVACDMSVLLTSYTHSAVDNVLLKLAEYDIDFLRLGAEHNVHPKVRRHLDSRLMKKTSGVAQLAVEMEGKQVVASTALGMKHALFTRHTFDVCIVDEASQISQLVCLGPLFSASKFVLVGDQCQLPPLVQSSRARNLGMDESLFQRLVSAHNSCAVKLSFQFRMNAEIMSLSNHLVYDGAMRCGNETVSTATVGMPSFDDWCQTPSAEAWLVEALRPSTVVSFLNTDQVASRTDTTDANTNVLEARLVKQIIHSLIECGCDAGNIGVISPYRRQCKLLTSTLADLGSGVKAVEVNTVDKYQGRDKKVIVVSFSHSALDSQGGSILSDIRRLNVAITRAKHKLLLIGSLRVLKQFQPLERLITFLHQNNLISFLHEFLTTVEV